MQRCLVQYLVRSWLSSKYSSDSLHHLFDHVCYFAVILWLCGMPIFDSIITAMGRRYWGFAVYNDSIAHYHSDLITYVVTVGTLLFGVNFNLYFYILLP